MKNLVITVVALLSCSFSHADVADHGHPVPVNLIGKTKDGTPCGVSYTLTANDVQFVLKDLKRTLGTMKDDTAYEVPVQDQSYLLSAGYEGSATPAFGDGNRLEIYLAGKNLYSPDSLQSGVVSPSGKVHWDEDSSTCSGLQHVVEQ